MVIIQLVSTKLETEPSKVEYLQLCFAGGILLFQAGFSGLMEEVGKLILVSTLHTVWQSLRGDHPASQLSTNAAAGASATGKGSGVTLV